MVCRRWKVTNKKSHAGKPRRHLGPLSETPFYHLYLKYHHWSSTAPSMPYHVQIFHWDGVIFQILQLSPTLCSPRVTINKAIRRQNFSVAHRLEFWHSTVVPTMFVRKNYVTSFKSNNTLTTGCILCQCKQHKKRRAQI